MTLLAPVLTWLVLAGLYLGFAGAASVAEGVAAGLTALAGAALSVALRRTGERHLRFHAPWGRVLSKPLAALGADLVPVGRALWWATPGVCERQAFRQGGHTPEAAGRRALVTLAASLAPNGFVLRIADHENALTLHRLAPHPPSPNRDWPL